MTDNQEPEWAKRVARYLDADWYMRRGTPMLDDGVNALRLTGTGSRQWRMYCREALAHLTPEDVHAEIVRRRLAAACEGL